MPRRDGNRSGARRRSGRNHALMNSGRKGKQRTRKYLLRTQAMERGFIVRSAKKKEERTAMQRDAANSTLTGRALAPDVASGRRSYLRL